MRRARASSSASSMGSQARPDTAAILRRICSISTSSTSEITDEMP